MRYHVSLIILIYGLIKSNECDLRKKSALLIGVCLLIVPAFTAIMLKG